MFNARQQDVTRIAFPVALLAYKACVSYLPFPRLMMWVL
jgi:hypothetical protein